jgi:hypothetical protein
VASFEGIWIQAAGDPAAAAGRLRRLGRLHGEIREIHELRFERGAGWLLATVPGDSIPAAARLVSRELSSVCVGLLMQSVADCLGFWHYRGGREIRRLTYGFQEQGSWEEVSGSPEPWEEELLWSTPAQDILEYAPEEEHERIRSILAERILRPGAEVPPIDARSLAAGILRFYDIPTVWPERVKVGPPWPLRRLAAFW